MTTEEIVSKFANALKKFDPIDRQPSDTDLMRIREVVAPLLLQIPYDKTGGTHNLIGFVRLVAAYTTRYGAEFVEPTRMGSYEATINDDTTAVVYACTEAVIKSKRANRSAYKTARRETAQFIIAVAEDTWLR